MERVFSALDCVLKKQKVFTAVARRQNPKSAASPARHISGYLPRIARGGHTAGRSSAKERGRGKREVAVMVRARRWR